MPLEWPLLAVTVSVQLSELRRAVEPMSRAVRPCTSPSKSSATSAHLPAAIRSRRAISIGLPHPPRRRSGTTVMSAFLSVPARLHRAQRGDHHRHAALVVAGARALRRHCRGGPSAGTASPARTPCRDGRSAACACRGRCPCGVATRWPARPVALHVDPLDREAQRLELGAEHLADRLDAREVQRAAVLVDPFSRASRRCAPARHRRCAIMRLLGAAERGGGGRGDRAERKRGERRSGKSDVMAAA